MHGAELRLFHVVRNGSHGRDAEGLIAYLFALTRNLPERGRVSAALAYGDPSSEIIQHARLTRADLIVLGTERRSAPDEVRRTIVADVATRAPCPVLHVRPHLLPSSSSTIRGFTEILCCVDPPPNAMNRDDHAYALAHRSDARVTLLNILLTDDDARQAVHEAAKDADGSRHVIRVSLTGSPGPEIVELAKRIGSDLIVMGAAAETSPTLKLGSTTAYVLVHAPCPVLIVPPACNASHIQANHLGARDARELFQ